MPTIPEWVPPVVPADDLNNQRDLNKTLATVIAEDEPLPIIVGEQQVGGKIFAVFYDAGTWTVGVAWCVGECQSIVATYLNGAAPVAAVSQNDYLGTTSQTADALLSAAIPGYSDDLVITRPGGDIGVCYSVYQYTDDDYKSFPQFAAQIQGLKTNGGVYSDTPAHGLGHLIEHPILGPNLTADATSLGTVVTDNQATVITEERRKIGLVIDEPMPYPEWLKILSQHAACWTFRRGNTYCFTSDRPRSQDAAYTTDDWDSFALQFNDRDRIPTVVELVYTDTQETIWRERTVTKKLSGVDAGTTPRRVSRVKMLGVTRYSQAAREAQERLNKLQNFLGIAYDGFDDAIVHEPGDVIDITRGSHLTNVDFRIVAALRKTLGGPVVIQGVKYNASDYVDTEESAPTPGANDRFQGGGTSVDWPNVGDSAGTKPDDNATRNSITSGTATPTGGANGDLYYETDAEAWWAKISGTWQQVGDNTAANIAAGISGQGSLATQNTADYGSDVSGTKPPADATRNSITSGTATPSGGVDGDLYYETDAEAWWARISGTWQKVGDTTAANIAAGISGQGGLATKSAADWASEVTGTGKPEDNATEGADLGSNVRNEAGGVLSDIDVRNDELVTTALSALNANPSMQQSRRTSAGGLAPASWFSWGSTRHIAYESDSARDILALPDNAIRSSNAAFRVNTDTQYEFAALVKLTAGTGNIELHAMEYNSELPTGKRAVGINAGTVVDSELVVRDATVNVVTATALGTSYAVVSGIYTPNTAAVWASLVVEQDSVSGGQVRVEWAVVRERSTRNKLFRQTTAPSASESSEGALWYDTDDDIWYTYISGSWQRSAPEGGDTATTVTDSGTGTTSATATIVRGGANTTIVIDTQISGSVAGGGDPGDITVTIKRGTTTIKTWSGLKGEFEAGGGGDPDIFFFQHDASYIDTNTGTGSTDYEVTISGTAYTESSEITATQTYFT